MSVWRVREIFRGRKGGLAEGSERKYSRVFQVFTNSKLDGPIEVMFGVDPNTGEAIPLLYSAYRNFGATEVDLLAICRSIEPVQDEDDWTVWTVTCEYSTASVTGDAGIGQAADGGNPRSGSGASSDPELEPPTVEWGEWSREEAVARAQDDGGDDSKGTPILNAAGQPFDPAPTRETGGVTLVVERNELVYHADDKLEFFYTINENEFIYAEDDHEWLCKPITARRQYKGGMKYWRVRYEFWHSNDHWNVILLNAGFDELVGGKLRPIMINGSRVSRPYPLSATGRALTPEFIRAGKVKYRHCFPYKRKEFEGLEIALDKF